MKTETNGTAHDAMKARAILAAKAKERPSDAHRRKTSEYRDRIADLADQLAALRQLVKVEAILGTLADMGLSPAERQAIADRLHDHGLTLKAEAGDFKPLAGWGEIEEGPVS